MAQKIIKIGTSIGATFPRHMREAVGLKEGDIIEVTPTKEKDALIVRKLRTKKRTVKKELIDWSDRFISKYHEALEELADK